MQIKFAQQRDAGAYECQVNTVPKMSMTFQLNVVGKCGWLLPSSNGWANYPKQELIFFLCLVHFPQTEAKALILGPTDIYVKIGSAVTLTCIITQGPHDLGTIYWYRGKQISPVFAQDSSWIPVSITCRRFLFSSAGTNIIKPTETHPNETSIAYPPRISVDLKWTEALTSR